MKIFDNIKHQRYHKLAEKIYKENYNYFYKIAYSILENKEDTEDSLQEAFVKGYDYIEKFSNMECPEIKRYFVYIIRSVSNDMKKNRSKIVFSEFSDELIDSVANEKGVDEVVQEILENKKLYSLLDILNRTEYEILEFKAIDKLTFKEISNKIGISEEAAKKRYPRLLKKLRNASERGLKND